MFVVALIAGVFMASLISLCITMKRLIKSNELGNSKSSFLDLSCGIKMIARDDGVNVGYVETLITANEKNYRAKNQQKNMSGQSNMQQGQQYSQQMQQPYMQQGQPYMQQGQQYSQQMQQPYMQPQMYNQNNR